MTQDLKGCPHCNSPIPDGHLFCFSCGKTLFAFQKRQSTSIITQPCASCGKKFAYGLLFCPNCGAVKTTSPSKNLSTTNISVLWNSQKEKSKAATELIKTPPGVNIVVKRSRTIEHIVEVNWQISGKVSIEAGLKEIIMASIQTEIVRTEGNTYKKSETMEYEVQLNGSVHNSYLLVWTDIWSVGTAHTMKGIMSYDFPFQYREKTELDVIPLQEDAETK